MKRASLAIGLATIVTISTAMFGASAFTSATVSRSPQINVAADGAGPISLSDGDTGIEKIDSNGELSISVSQLSANVDGLNPNATYTFGNETAINGSSSPSASDYVFSITNEDTSSHDVTVEFTSSNSLSANNVQFTLVKADQATGGKKTVKVGSGNSKTVTLSSGETWYVVATFNTGLNGANYVSNSSALSGTLNITV